MNIEKIRRKLALNMPSICAAVIIVGAMVQAERFIGHLDGINKNIEAVVIRVDRLEAKFQIKPEPNAAPMCPACPVCKEAPL